MICLAKREGIWFLTPSSRSRYLTPTRPSSKCKVCGIHSYHHHYHFRHYQSSWFITIVIIVIIIIIIISSSSSSSIHNYHIYRHPHHLYHHHYYSDKGIDAKKRLFQATTTAICEEWVSAIKSAIKLANTNKQNFTRRQSLAGIRSFDNYGKHWWW